MTPYAETPRAESTEHAIAEPAPATLRNVYIVQVEMSSPAKVLKTEVVDDMTRTVRLEFGPETREAIKDVRATARGLLEPHCFLFHGLRVIREQSWTEVERVVGAADTALKAIHPELYATVHRIPLSVDTVARGELYESLISAIRGQVYQVLLERLEGLAQKKDVPERSRVALLKLCDRMRDWNVVDDPTIAETIENFRVQFQHGVLAPVAEEVKKAVDSTGGAGVYLEV